MSRVPRTHAKQPVPSASERSDYTTAGEGDDWYGHEGEPADWEKPGGNDTNPPFEESGPRDDKKAGKSADYAYGGYGPRAPGHARSAPDPSPPAPPKTTRQGI